MAIALIARAMPARLDSPAAPSGRMPLPCSPTARCSACRARMCAASSRGWSPTTCELRQLPALGRAADTAGQGACSTSSSGPTATRADRLRGRARARRWRGGWRSIACAARSRSSRCRARCIGRRQRRGRARSAACRRSAGAGSAPPGEPGERLAARTACRSASPRAGPNWATARRCGSNATRAN